MNLARLKELDAVLHQNQYRDEVFIGMLPYVELYLQSLPRLRELPLREVKAATVMLAGGER